MFMIFTATTPTLRVRVHNSFLGLFEEGNTEAYLIAVTSIPNGILAFTVHLETGAIWSRLPINALFMRRFKPDANPSIMPLNVAQPYSCIEGSIMAIAHPYLKNYEVLVYLNGDRNSLPRKGHYLFTVDYLGEGLAEDPVQFKTHNICVLDTGELIAYPNNFLLFPDNYFTSNNLLPEYKRQDKFYLPGG
jgi:hypothetical protein